MINIRIRHLAHFEPTSTCKSTPDLKFHYSKSTKLKIHKKRSDTHLLTDELSLGAFISIKRFLIMTSSPAQAAAALTSSSERPFSHKTYNGISHDFKQFKKYIRKHEKIDTTNELYKLKNTHTKIKIFFQATRFYFILMRRLMNHACNRAAPAAALAASSTSC